MPTISQLSAVTSLSSGDNIVIQSAANNDARKASLSVLQAFIEANFASPEFETVISAPSIDGFNLQLAASTSSIWAIINNVNSYLAATLTLPPVADCFDGQQIIATFDNSINVLTVAGNGATVNGAPSVVGDGGFFALRFNALQSEWYCVSQSLGTTTAFTDVTITNAILDANGNEILALTPASVSAVNHVLIANTATGLSPGILPEGTDANIGITIETKGDGNILLAPAGAGLARIVAEGLEVTATYTLFSAATTTMSGAVDCLTLVADGVTTTDGLVAGLGSAATKGQRKFVTDSNQTMAAGIGLAVATGGANNVPVYSDGTIWRIG